MKELFKEVHVTAAVVKPNYLALTGGLPLNYWSKLHADQKILFGDIVKKLQADLKTLYKNIVNGHYRFYQSPIKSISTIRST